MRGLDFEHAAQAQRPDPNRVDIACFVGFVARREGALPASVRAELARARWTDGPWARPAAELETLLQLPVTVGSWAAFDALFAWEARPLGSGAGRCAGALGAAVRRFFACGGRRAVIVRCGDPWPHLEAASARAAHRAARLEAVLAPGASAMDPSSWRGIGHLHGLPETTLVCLPDLPDLCAADPATVAVATEPPAAAEIFVECSEGGSEGGGEDLALRAVAPPRCDGAGFAAWRDAIGRVRLQLARHHRDKLLLAALPLPTRDLRHAAAAGDTWAQADMLAYLERSGVLAPAAAGEGAATASAFVQLAWPWLKTAQGTDLPGQLEAPDGLLAGLVARNALARGTFRSIAGTPLPAVFGTEPVLPWSAIAATATDALARRVCVVAPQPGGGWALQSDVSTAADEGWRAGGVTRLMGAVLRAARTVAANTVFEASGPALWRSVERSLENTLNAFWREGGLGGADPGEAFSVRCDLGTMSRNDLDNGRLRAQVSLLPAAALERITVMLELAGAGELATTGEVT
jgi:hypothetical protein